MGCEVKLHVFGWMKTCLLGKTHASDVKCEWWNVAQKTFTLLYENPELVCILCARIRGHKNIYCVRNFMHERSGSQ